MKRRIRNLTLVHLYRNGKTSGITQPSADLQEAVIRKAYSNAKLGFADTDYVECHGTGTPVGDPIEVDAISRCFSREGAPLMIGSVGTHDPCRYGKLQTAELPPNE